MRSTRKHAAAFHFSCSNGRRFLLKDLNFHLYKSVVVQDLSEHNKANLKVSMGIYLLVTVENVLLMSDEVHFHLFGWVKKQLSVWFELPSASRASSVLFTCNCLVWCSKFWDHSALLFWSKLATGHCDLYSVMEAVRL